MTKAPLSTYLALRLGDLVSINSRTMGRVFKIRQKLGVNSVYTTENGYILGNTRNISINIEKGQVSRRKEG